MELGLDPVSKITLINLRRPRNMKKITLDFDVTEHGLRTANEGINQKNLKSWTDLADKICFSRTYKFGIGI